MNIDYTVQIWKEEDQYIAHATPLDVASSGPNPEEARAALKEAVHLFLETALEIGTLEEILDECGYESKGNTWVSPSWIAIERQSTAIGA
jgi:predicted RNase H-like HicB family nuclease